MSMNIYREQALEEQGKEELQREAEIAMFERNDFKDGRYYMLCEGGFFVKLNSVYAKRHYWHNTKQTEVYEVWFKDERGLTMCYVNPSKSKLFHFTDDMSRKRREHWMEKYGDMKMPQSLRDFMTEEI